MRYRTKIKPFLTDSYGMTPSSFAVIRHPINQIAIWYRYRQNVSEANSERSTEGRSFDEFVLAVIEK
jgi:hypothetical protein|tara:strand:+ start:106 stop:306 length:201 start_codon:yes stop_codon:yes gene_type:complete